MFNRNFTIFCLGNIISAIGDQISLTAFPWLMLQLTGDPGAVGLTLAVAGLPRAILMLYGGAVTDRLSPRLVMLYTSFGRMAAVLVLAWLLYANLVTVPLVYLLALIFGLIDAFYYPAANAIVPALVEGKDLQKANGLNQMIYQAALVFGPLLAAFAIAGKLSGTVIDSQEIVTRFEEYRLGLARAFALDGLTFLFSIFTLAIISTRNLKDETADEGESLVSQIKKAIRFVWQVPAMRLAFIGMAGLEFFFQSPVFVGLPALSALRYEEGAAAFAQMVACYGAGALVGGGIGGWTKPIKASMMVPLLFVFFGWSSFGFGAIILYDPLWWACAIFVTAGLTDGFIFTQFMTWIQRHTPDAMLGRVMSILMVMNVGLLPLAHVIIGQFIAWDVELAIIVSSVLMVVMCLVGAVLKDARNMGTLSTAPTR